MLFNGIFINNEEYIGVMKFKFPEPVLNFEPHYQMKNALIDLFVRGEHMMNTTFGPIFFSEYNDCFINMVKEFYKHPSPKKTHSITIYHNSILRKLYHMELIGHSTFWHLRL